jgi:DNA-binding NarL/FixJ family response regulator
VLIEREKIFGNGEIRCLLAHDHVLLRQGLRRLLEDEPDMEVVAEAGNAAEALRKVFEHRPEIVIVDAHLFECAADHAERLLLRECRSSNVLFLTAQEEGEPREVRVDAIRCVVRHTSAEELVEMVRRTHAARKTLARDGAERPDSGHGELAPEAPPVRKRVLTAREREVLKLLAEGRTVRSAACVLGLSAKTVDAHKFNLMRKLGIHNKAELVMWAIQKRVVKLPANF